MRPFQLSWPFVPLYVTCVATVVKLLPDPTIWHLGLTWLATLLALALAAFFLFRNGDVKAGLALVALAVLHVVIPLTGIGVLSVVLLVGVLVALTWTARHLS